MDWDEIETAEPFGFGHETIERVTCDCGCGRFVDDYDPIEIDGKLFSDYCASDLVALRIDGTIKGVSIKTNKLKS